MPIGRIDFVAAVYVPGQGNESDCDPEKEHLTVEPGKGDEFGLPGVQGLKLTTKVAAKDYGPVFVPLSNIAGVHLAAPKKVEAPPAAKEQAKGGK